MVSTQPFPGSLHKTLIRLQGCSTDIGALSQCTRFFIAANDDACPFVQLPLVVMSCAVGLDATIDRNAATVCQQINTPALAAGCVDQAIGHDAGRMVVQCGCLHVNLPTIGDDGARLALLDACIDLRWGQNQLDASCATHRHLDGFRSPQQRSSTLGFDFAFVVHRCAQKRDITTCRFNGALVHHRSRAAITLVKHIASHEVRIRDAKRGGSETRRIDAAVFSKQHAVGVDQDHMAIGLQLSKNLTGTLTQHAVKQYRLGIGLDDLHLGLRADVKTLPIDGRALCRLMNGELVGCVAQTGCTLNNMTGRWQGVCRRVGPSQTDQRKTRSQSGQVAHSRWDEGPRPRAGP